MTQQFCAICGNEIRNIKDAAKEVVGWIIPRDGGGANHIHGKVQTGNLACPTCARYTPVHKEQGDLFGDD